MIGKIRVLTVCQKCDRSTKNVKAINQRYGFGKYRLWSNYWCEDCRKEHHRNWRYAKDES